MVDKRGLQLFDKPDEIVRLEAIVALAEQGFANAEQAVEDAKKAVQKAEENLADKEEALNNAKKRHGIPIS